MARVLAPTLAELERATALLGRVRDRHDALVVAAIDEGHDRCEIAIASGLTADGVRSRERRMARGLVATGRKGRRKLDTSAPRAA